MQKVISLDTQYKLLFVPIINISIYFIWWHNFKIVDNSRKLHVKALLLIMSIAFSIFIITTEFTKYIQISEIIISIIMYYFIPLAIGIALIIFQKKHNIAK